VIEVCEGQALDLEFEQRTDVSLPDYFAMIERKTGRLFSVSTELGALVGGGQPEEARALRRFGHHLGKAFQLQDDLLDVIGEEREFGKTIGGDIVEGKRTFLLLTALERARGEHRRTLQKVLGRKAARPKRPLSPRDRRILVSSIRALYVHYGVLDETRHAIMHNTALAVHALAPLRPSQASRMLEWLARKLVDRVS
jgi:geranylgeranyl diphosphate synthase type II